MTEAPPRFVGLISKPKNADENASKIPDHRIAAAYIVFLIYCTLQPYGFIYNT